MDRRVKAQEQTNSAIEGIGKKALERTHSKERPEEPAKGVRYDLEESVLVDSSTAATSAWQVFDCSDYVPSTARFAVLQCYGRNISAPTGARDWQARRESGAIVRRCVTLRGTTTSDISVMVCEAHIELTGSKSFEWQADAMTEREIHLIGYLT